MKMEVLTKARARKPAAGLRWHGAIEGIHRGLVYGWAIDAERPHANVVLEVCLNDHLIGTVIADVARTDLIETFDRAAPGADACHGFVADLRLDEKATGVISVRAANTDHCFPGAAAWNDAPKPSVSATSNVYSDGGLRLHGWAIDSVNENRKLKVAAFVGSTKVAEALANLATPAVRTHTAAGHAFTLDLPLSLADGYKHTVRIVDESGTPLNGSPISVCTFAGGARALLPANGNALVSEVIDSYERYIPRSVGFQHYVSWKKQFEPASIAGSSRHQVGMLVIPNNDAAAIADSVKSLEMQLGATVKVIVHTDTAIGIAPDLDSLLNAGCTVIGMIRAGDILREHAIATALKGFDAESAAVVYTDSEFKGKPWFKPAWNTDYACATDYPLELMLVRSTLATRLLTTPKQSATTKSHQSAASFAWNALMAASAQGPDAIVHVPHVLYEFNSPLTPDEIADRTAACRRALPTIEPALTLIEQQPVPAAFHAARRVARPLSKAERATKVSLVIPTRDYADMLERCISSIQQFTDWPNLEIIVIDNGSAEPKTKSYFRKISKQGVRVLPMPGTFNFADLNNRAIEQATGEIVGLINNDIEALHDGWLDEIVGQLLRPNVGAVGAKLLWPNGMVQHGGVLMGVGNAAGHFGNLLSEHDWGDHGRNQLVQQVTGVTAACMFIRKADYIALDGMDASAFPVAFNDVDLCLKVREAGKSIIWTPHAKLLHAESASRGHEDSPQKRARAQRELERLRQRWGHALLQDPAYHPSLNLDPHSNAFGGLALPPRCRSPRTARLVSFRNSTLLVPAAEKSATVKPVRVKKMKQA